MNDKTTPSRGAEVRPEHRTRTILRSYGLRSAHRLVLIALCDQMDDEGRAWPTVAHLCRLSSYSERTVQGVLRDGLEGGWLVVLPSDRRMRTFQIRWDLLPVER